MASSPIGRSLIVLESVDSSNNYAMAKAKAGQAKHGDVFFALQQTAGKGQRGRQWLTRAAENITLSVVLETAALPRSSLFLLSMAMALGAHDWLKAQLGANCSIKWPNDLYWRDRKTGGILIENSWLGTNWQFAIAGIGINVNQTNFDLATRNPASIKQISGNELEILPSAADLCSCLEIRWQQLLSSNAKNLLADFNAVLYRRNQPVRLKQGNAVFETTIREVTLTGELITHDVLERCFQVGDVEWLV